MKKHLITAVLFLLVLNGFSQVEQEEAPMFGTTRGSAFEYNFETVTGVSKSYTFYFENKGNSVMKVTSVTIPEQIGITMVEKEIKPGGKLAIIATVDPTIANPGNFKKEIKISIKQDEPGISTTRDITYLVYGIVK